MKNTNFGRDTLPDPKYGSEMIARFINMVMKSGKKSVAERIVYGALTRIEERDSGDPVEVFEKALDAVAPFVEVNQLPEETLPFLLPSRYCESDRFTQMASSIAAGWAPGYDQRQRGQVA